MMNSARLDLSTFEFQLALSDLSIHGLPLSSESVGRLYHYIYTHRDNPEALNVKLQSTGDTLLLILIKRNYLELLDFLLEEIKPVGIVNVPGSSGITPLIQACRDGSFHSVRRLLQVPDIEIDAIGLDPDDNTALFHAIICGHAEIVELLLSKNARTDIDCDKALRCIKNDFREMLRFWNRDELEMLNLQTIIYRLEQNLSQEEARDKAVDTLKNYGIAIKNAESETHYFRYLENQFKGVETNRSSIELGSRANMLSPICQPEVPYQLCNDFAINPNSPTESKFQPLTPLSIPEEKKPDKPKATYGRLMLFDIPLSPAFNQIYPKPVTPMPEFRIKKTAKLTVSVSDFSSVTWPCSPISQRNSCSMLNSDLEDPCSPMMTPLIPSRASSSSSFSLLPPASLASQSSWSSVGSARTFTSFGSPLPLSSQSSTSSSVSFTSTSFGGGFVSYGYDSPSASSIESWDDCKSPVSTNSSAFFGTVKSHHSASSPNLSTIEESDELNKTQSPVKPRRPRES